MRSECCAMNMDGYCWTGYTGIHLTYLHSTFRIRGRGLYNAARKKKKRFKIFEIISRKSSKRVFIAIWCQVVPSAVVADGVVIALIKEAKAHFEKSRFINLTTIVLMTNRNLSRIDLK